MGKRQHRNPDLSSLWKIALLWAFLLLMTTMITPDPKMAPEKPFLRPLEPIESKPAPKIPETKEAVPTPSKAPSAPPKRKKKKLQPKVDKDYCPW